MELPYTTHQVSVKLDLPYQTLMSRIKAGRIDATKHGNMWLLDRAYIDDLAARGLTQNPEFEGAAFA